MNQAEQDRAIERDRYDRRAAAVLQADQVDQLGVDGAAGICPVLRTPYLEYERLIRACSSRGRRILDLCCGNGQHSLTAARLGAEVVVSDFAPHNVELAVARAERAGVSVQGLVADAERVPLPRASFDGITCAGSLSYVDLDRFLGEVVRLLRPGGFFIFVDSLNHHPVYRFNRWVHFKRGRRSRSTLQRMPTLRTLERMREFFPDLQVSYHGIFTFLAPLLPLPDVRVAKTLDDLDRQWPSLHRFAFKIVGAGTKPVRVEH